MGYNAGGIERTPEFDAWFQRQHRDVRNRLDKRILRVAAGNLGDARPVGEGVFELRIDFGPGYRVYFCRWKDGIALLLCGGDKSTQPRDIERARAMRKQLPWH